MKHSILIVDDDTNLLNSYCRKLRKRFEVETATSGDQALEAMEETGPFSVVISDYRMPGMDGVEFLSRARKAAPNSVRMLLTGHADLETAIEAVNRGNIFRLLTKPCPPKVMANALVDALRQYEMATAEQELLDKTVKGVVNVLSEVVSILEPDMFGRTQRVIPFVRTLARGTGGCDPWSLETATMLSTLGFLVVPEDIRKEALEGKHLSPRKQEAYIEHATFAGKLLSGIPRLEDISRILAYQEKHYDGSGPPGDDLAGKDLPLGSRILKVVNDFDLLTSGGEDQGKAFAKLKARKGHYDPDVLRELGKTLGDSALYVRRKVYLHGLEVGMILARDVYAHDNGKKFKIMRKGQQVTETALDYFFNMADKYLDKSRPFEILEPTDKSAMCLLKVEE